MRFHMGEIQACSFKNRTWSYSAVSHQVKLWLVQQLSGSACFIPDLPLWKFIDLLDIQVDA